MNEHLQRHGQMALAQLALQPFEIGESQLSGQNNALATEGGGLGHTGRTRDRHLGGTVQHETGYQFLRQTAETDVLHDHRIDTGLGSGDQQFRRSIQLIAEHKHVEGEEAPHIALMQPMHQLGQLADAEVVSPLSGIEGINTEINGVRAVGDGCLERVPVTSWGKELRNAQGLRLEKRRAASNRRRASAVPSKRQCQGS